MPSRIVGELNPPDRLLLGPGPANVSPRVLRALATPLLGHLDPAFLSIMDDTVYLLRQVFQTSNHVTIPISGTGSAGMEAALCNVVEPGDTVVIGINGYFGERLAEMASRYGARVVRVEAEWGLPLELEKIQKALKAERSVKVVAVVHAETSTGVLQPLDGLANLARSHDALLLVDAVTSLGGIDLRVDDWEIDICYSGTQKCLGAPPGLSPLTFGPRAVEVLRSRKTKVANWYLDLTLLGQYWGGERVYHHTAPISMIYALREALRIVDEEGLQKRFARHRRSARALWAGLEAMGIGLIAPEGYRAYSLTTVRIPEGVDDAALRRTLLEDWSIEIGGGLGPLRGKAWRVGLMGYNSTAKSVLTFLAALESALVQQGLEIAQGAGAAAAQRALAAADQASD
ncbi:MAG: alanine--glyoxylate aminotransferase family protein [Chloroflexi bacterium]|nr:alanine--glyoxylate aminotransferase family protein [Chloroflexota bacterium]